MLCHDLYISALAETRRKCTVPGQQIYYHYCVGEAASAVLCTILVLEKIRVNFHSLSEF
jgi:hypothetical protein